MLIGLSLRSHPNLWWSGGFVLTCKDWGWGGVGSWGEGEVIHFPLALFFFFFLKWRSTRAHRLHFLDQDKSTVAQRAKPTASRVFPDELRVS